MPSNPAREALTQAVNRALAEGAPEYVTEPQRYVMIENTPGYLSEEDEPYVSDDFDSVVAYMNERIDEYMDFITDGGGEPAVSKGPRFGYVTDMTREHDLGRNFSVEEYEDA